MPINYKNYPPDWKQRRARILKRAGDCCEFCGVKNHAVGARGQDGVWHEEGQISASDANLMRIVLTIAHLDHDETNWNVNDERLRALCQRCHIRYDAAEKARRVKSKKYKTGLSL